MTHDNEFAPPKFSDYYLVDNQEPGPPTKIFC